MSEKATVVVDQRPFSDNGTLIAHYKNFKVRCVFEGDETYFRIDANDHPIVTLKREFLLELHEVLEIVTEVFKMDSSSTSLKLEDLQVATAICRDPETKNKNRKGALVEVMAITDTDSDGNEIVLRHRSMQCGCELPLVFTDEKAFPELPAIAKMFGKTGRNVQVKQYNLKEEK